MKQRFKTWTNKSPEKGEINNDKSKTMPDMSMDPRTIIENHVRGINPITGAVLDRGIYYGQNILPYEKDLTYEELRLKRIALERKAKELVQLDRAAQSASATPQENEEVL
jgi:hypothetical protein